MKNRKLARILLILAMVMAVFIWAAALGEDSLPEEGLGATQTDLDSDENDDPGFMDDPEPVISYDVSGETLAIPGDAMANGDNTNVTAINITSLEGAQSAVSVKGGVSAQGTSSFYSHATSTGMEIYVSGQGGSAEAVIADGVSSVMQWTNYEEGDNINCAGISVTVEEGGSAGVTVEQGGIYAEAHGEDSDSPPYTWAAGVHLYNTDGKADIRITGDVTAESYVYGVGLNSHLYGSQEASTLIIVDGDVYGKTRGIWAENANPGASMEIIVDGTVSGDMDPIWVDGSERDSIMLTVWKAEPSEDGALVVITDNEENHVRSEKAEKALQYIIRVSPEDKDKIQVDAREYYGYLTAREGDQIRIRVSVPSGRRIKAVYANQDQSVALEQAEDGSYLLTVPWGGGVELSVLTATKSAETAAETATETAIAPVPALIPAEGSDETSSLKDSIRNAENGTEALPDSIAGLLPDPGAEILETLTLTLVNYTEEAGTPELIIPSKQDYLAGKEYTVIFAVPRDGGFDCFSVCAVGTADGKLGIQPDAGTLKVLADKTFIALICSVSP